MISPSCGKVCSNSKGQKNLGASIQKNFGRFSEKRPKFFLCTFGAKSTKILRTSFSAGLREPRRCTGRARSCLCATPWRTRCSPHPLFPRQTRVRIDCAASDGIIWHAPRILFTRKAIPDLVPMAKKRAEAESESGGDGLLANPRSRQRRGRFACKPAQSPDAAFRRPDADIGIGRVAFAAFRHRKAGKKIFLVLLAPKVQKKERGIPMRKFLSLSTLTKFYQRNWIKARKPDVLILLAEKSRSPEKVL